jgi:alpha-L-fucosidase
MTVIRRAAVCAVLFALALPAMAQAPKYEANWKSLDSRPIPKWFQDAKFGVFIHWGIYSVPAWGTKGSYSEWYQYRLKDSKEFLDHHVKKYGADFPYANFAEQFKAEDFDPDAWAQLLQNSGARYVVLTSKHHDGFALWPSAEASRDFARPWNSMDAAAHRDLVGDLANAVRKTDVKFGLYYSLYEWFDPLYQQKDKTAFVEQHFLPQIKDLVTRYKPAVLWADGDWELPDTTWKSPEFLAWLYNDSPVRDDVVVNDRWGKGTARKHGGYYTPEYSQGETYDHPWEECRGMGFSFGYNANEDIQDYASAQALVLMLSDIVSRGGNLLLDIGPDDRGKIPPIMQERLLQMGEWLKVNGEAIYGTHKWKETAQWSEGKRDWNSKHPKNSGEYFLKLTVDPDPGYAVKQAMFTAKDDAVYAIMPKFPEKQFVLRNVKAGKATAITLLGTEKKYSWRQAGSDLVIAVPPLSVNDAPPTGRYAYVFKLTNVQ